MKDFIFFVDKKGRCDFKDVEIIVTNLKEKIDMLEIKNKILQKDKERLQHLLQSKFIRSFDEKYFCTGEYKRDIKEADEIANFHYEHSGTPILTGDDAKAFTKAFIEYLERRYL